MPELLPAGYTPLRRLQRGRAVDVYEVWSDERACRCVAKCLRLDRTQEPRSWRRLLREGRLLRRLTHLHLVRAYEVVPEPPTVILEALTGKTLERRLELEGRLPIDEVVAIGTQLCSVLHYLHGLSLLHLDLKPSNIVCERGLIKLLDLSIARPPGRSRSGIGTRMYMAPEQARGGLVSAATDVWGMGIVLFECASGRRPFGQSAAGATYPQLVDRAPSIGHFRRRMPTQLRQLIDASLAPTASERPSLREISCTLMGLAQAD